MIDVLIKILPLDLASTMSPGLLALTIALLAKKGLGFKKTLALGLGSLIVAIILAIIGLKLGQTVQDPNNTKIIDNIVDLILAALFLYFGIKSLVQKEDQPKTNLLDKNGAGQLVKWFAIGFIISITNFDAVALNLSAAKEVGQAVINSTQKFILLAINSLFFILPILIPIVFYVFTPKLMDRIFAPLNIFLTKYGRLIVGMIFIVFAIYLGYKGLKIFF
jgi:threonine/homoserine/homoserine lactone efflux protein